MYVGVAKITTETSKTKYFLSFLPRWSFHFMTYFPQFFLCFWKTLKYYKLPDVSLLPHFKANKWYSSRVRSVYILKSNHLWHTLYGIPSYTAIIYTVYKIDSKYIILFIYTTTEIIGGWLCRRNESDRRWKTANDVYLIQVDSNEIPRPSLPWINILDFLCWAWMCRRWEDEWNEILNRWFKQTT